MTVELTSPVLGQAVGTTYTGTLEPWLLAEGYAKQAGYTGPGVSNTGATDIAPADDPTLASNRDDAPYFPATEDRRATVANDADNLNESSFPFNPFDFDAGGVDDDAPAEVSLDPAEGPAAGGTTVTITGQSLVGVTSVTFDGVAGTALDVADAEEGTITVVTPAGTAGPADVVLVDADGNTTLTGGFTYTA